MANWAPKSTDNHNVKYKFIIAHHIDANIDGIRWDNQI